MKKGKQIMEKLKGSESRWTESPDLKALLVLVRVRLQVSAVQQNQQVVHEVSLASQTQKLSNVATLRTVRVETRAERVLARRKPVLLRLFEQAVALRLRFQLLADDRQQVQEVLLVVGVRRVERRLHDAADELCVVLHEYLECLLGLDELAEHSAGVERRLEVCVVAALELFDQLSHDVQL